MQRLRLHVSALRSAGFVILLAATASPAVAQSVTVTLEPAGIQIVAPTGNIDYAHHWGTVRFAGQPVATYVARVEILSASFGADNTIYPSVAFSMWIRLMGADDAMVLHGTSAAGPPIPSPTANGTVTAAPNTLSFLQGASFFGNPGNFASGTAGFLTFQY